MGQLQFLSTSLFNQYITPMGPAIETVATLLFFEGGGGGWGGAFLFYLIFKF
jgi:hypothetical protein